MSLEAISIRKESNFMSERISNSIKNFEKALGQLNEYLSSPVEDARDRSGVIQAFEFTFELVWKTFKKIADEEGLDAGGPKSSLKAALQIGYIEASEEDIYISMLSDRNLISHTYREELSKEIFERIKNQYLGVLNQLLKRLVAKMAK